MARDTWATAGFDLQRFASTPNPTDPSFWEDPGETVATTAPAATEHPADAQPAPTEPSSQGGETEPEPEPQPQAEPSGETDDGFWFAGRQYPSREEAERAYKSLQGELTRMKQGLPPKDPDTLEKLLGGTPAPPRPQPMPGYPQPGYPVYPQQPPVYTGYAQQAGMTTQQFGQQVQQAVAKEVAEAKDPKKVWAEIAKDPEGYYERKAQEVLQRAAAPVMQALSQLTVRQMLADMRADTENYPGFRELENDIAAYLMRDAEAAAREGRIPLAQLPGGLVHAYNAVVGINARAGLGAVQTVQEKSRNQVARSKQRATVESQRARPQPPPPVDPDEAEADAIVAAAHRKRFSI